MSYFLNDLRNLLAMYEATTLKELEAEFRCSVDEYLLSCEEFGRDVQQPCIGSFNIRTGEVLHR
ncbi:MAG: hypothetical protein KKD82_00895 [Gammaproteobacteria bacterium]|uniref:hypothetical protein n=1 Tax=Marinomonas polaris TaxID=293552 RepID=UPI0011149ADF|nr:hypothetical protein [Marinomonas polaris]MBU1293349.1 hypothetical protein [Gammaproteobacteria bacterium]